MDRYQDYIIRDGEFIGNFEEMYQKFADPWGQIQYAADSYSRHATILSINRLKLQNILEIGCGLGGGGKLLSDNCPNAKIDGMDISEPAIRRAKERYQNLHFFVGNLLEFSREKNHYDAIILSEIMWYILQDIDEIIENLSKNFKGKIIIINQTFYPEGVQKYGTEYFTNLDSMVDYLPWQASCKISIVCEETNEFESHSVYKI